MSEPKDKEWISLNEAASYLAVLGFDDDDIKRKLPFAIERCMVRCKGTINNKTGDEQKDVLFGWTWSEAEIDWDANAAGIAENITYRSDFDPVANFFNERDGNSVSVSDLTIARRDLTVWGRNSIFTPESSCWPMSTSVDLIRAASFIYSSDIRLLANDLKKLDQKQFNEVDAKTKVALINGCLSRLKQLAAASDVTVYGQRNGTEKYERIAASEWDILEFGNVVEGGAALSNSSVVWSDLRFNIAEINTYRADNRLDIWSPDCVLSFLHKEEQELSNIADQSKPTVPNTRRLNVREAVFVLAFHDINGGKIFDKYRTVYGMARFEELLDRAIRVIEEAASVGKLTVLGIPMLEVGNSTHIKIPETEWLTLKLEKQPIYDSQFSFRHGAETPEQEVISAKMSYIDLRFSGDEILGLHREVYGKVNVHEKENSSTSESRERRGRKGRNWDKFYAELCFYIHEKGCPNTQAVLEKHMLQWSEENMNSAPAESTVREKVRPVFRRFEEDRTNN